VNSRQVRRRFLSRVAKKTSVFKAQPSGLYGVLGFIVFLGVKPRFCKMTQLDGFWDFCGFAVFLERALLGRYSPHDFIVSFTIRYFLMNCDVSTGCRCSDIWHPVVNRNHFEDVQNLNKMSRPSL